MGNKITSKYRNQYLFERNYLYLSRRGLTVPFIMDIYSLRNSNPSSHRLVRRGPARTVERDTYTHIGHKP